jgi:hypothetical protein
VVCSNRLVAAKRLHDVHIRDELPECIKPSILHHVDSLCYGCSLNDRVVQSSSEVHDTRAKHLVDSLHLYLRVLDLNVALLLPIKWRYACCVLRAQAREWCCHRQRTAMPGRRSMADFVWRDMRNQGGQEIPRIAQAGVPMTSPIEERKRCYRRAQWHAMHDVHAPVTTCSIAYLPYAAPVPGTLGHWRRQDTRSCIYIDTNVGSWRTRTYSSSAWASQQRACKDKTPYCTATHAPRQTPAAAEGSLRHRHKQPRLEGPLTQASVNKDSPNIRPTPLERANLSRWSSSSQTRSCRTPC